MKNHFKDMLLNDIKMYELSKEVTDAHSEAKELLEFIKGYEYRLDYDYETYLEGFKSLTKADYKEIHKAIQSNNPQRRTVPMIVYHTNFSYGSNEKKPLYFRRPKKEAVAKHRY